MFRRGDEQRECLPSRLGALSPSPGFYSISRQTGMKHAGLKRTAFDRETEGRVQCFSATSYQPPSVSSVSLRLLRMHVKIGVSRNV